MKRFIEQHLLAALGVLLPLALVAVLLLVHGVARWSTSPPAYPVLYAQFDARDYEFRIDPRGRLEVFWRKVGTESQNRGPLLSGDSVTLVLHDAASSETEYFSIQAPEHLHDANTAIPIEVPPRLLDLRLRAGATAPDGAHFEVLWKRGGGFFPVLFGGYSGSRTQRLVKDGVVWQLPDSVNNPNFRSPVLIGWVEEGAGEPVDR